MVGMGTPLMAMVEGIMVEDTEVDIIVLGTEVDIVLDTEVDIGHQTTDHPIDLDLQILPQDQDDQRLYLQIDHLQVDLQRGRHDPWVDRLEGLGDVGRHTLEMG